MPRRLPGQFRLRDSPNRRCVPVLRYIDVAYRAADCLLPYLAAALAVSLAGQHCRPATRLADLPPSEREVDAGQAFIHPCELCSMPRAWRMSEVWSPALHPRSSDDSLGRHAGEAFGGCGVYSATAALPSQPATRAAR